MDNPVPEKDAARLAASLPLLPIGIFLFVLGPVLYFAQLKIPNYSVPWYLPILSTLGVLLMAVSAWQTRVVWRKIVLMLFLLLCGLEWFFLAELTKTPPYVGPARSGQKLPPPFAATRADGTAFTESDLEGDKHTVMVFFRGRW